MHVDKPDKTSVAALTSCQASVKASINALHPLSSLNDSTSSTSSLPILIAGLHTSFSSLLQQTRQTVTSLALSYKPPVTPDAAVAQLKTLEERYGQLASCGLLANAGNSTTESYLVQEWSDGIFDIGNQILGLLTVLADEEQGTTSDEKSPYLARTGMVWDAIDKVLADCSASKNHAACKRWQAQSELIKDAWNEYKESLEDEGEGDDARDGGVDSDLDDFEEVFGIKQESWTAAERARAQAVSSYVIFRSDPAKMRSLQAKTVLGLFSLLHTSLLRYFRDLAHEPDIPYTSLIRAGDRIVSAFDDAVDDLSPPQKTDTIEESMGNLAKASDELVRLLEARLEPSIGDQATKCKAFLGKWTTRLRQEQQAFAEQALSLHSLNGALA